MMDPVVVHLKDIDQREVKVIEEVVNAKIGAEGTAIVVLCNCTLIGDIAVLDRLLKNLVIAEEIASVGGQKAVQDPANWTYD